MKSSSQLFPVELVSAEVRDTYFEDSYSLKPNNSHDTSVEIALIHLLPKRQSQNKQIIFVHDAFQSHWQWMGGHFKTLVDDLISQGYSIWLMDWRAHGSSKKNRKPQFNSISEMANFDLPAVTQFIQEVGKSKAMIVASGFGALMALSGMHKHANIANYILIDSRSMLGQRRLLVPGIKQYKLLKLLGKDWIRGAGDELESASLARHQIKKGGWIATFTNKILKQQLEAVEQNAEKVIWLCTGRRSVSVANRHLKKRARINKVSPGDLAQVLLASISSQSI